MIIAKNHFENEEEKTKYCIDGEKGFREKLTETIEDLFSQNVKFYGLTGPTCAGKTTTANMIIKEAEKRNKRIFIVSIDDFFYDREYLLKMSKYDDSLKTDFDSVKTVDVETLKEAIEKMANGQPFKMPKYDFPKGMRTGYKKIESCRYDLFMFEGIQVLYPEIRALFSNNIKTVFIDAFDGIKFDDFEFSNIELRFLRRLVRDYYFRSASANLTYSLWGGVRENEEKSIYPYKDTCDYYINSTLPFEISVLRPYLEGILKFVRSDSINYKNAQSILNKIKFACPIDKKHLIENSLYVEFIPF